MPRHAGLRFGALLAAVRRHAPEVLGEATLAEASADPLIADVTHDHRSVTPGALYVARRGQRFDGHQVVAQALAAGAVAVVGERPTAELPELLPSSARAAPGNGNSVANAPYLAVPDARRALPHLAAAAHGYPSAQLRVIGITGTDGKTSTSFLLHWLLRDRLGTGLISTAGVRLGSEERDLVGHFTTPEASDVQRLLAAFVAGGASHAVLESSSHGFALNRLDAVDYDTGVVTNLSAEHLDFHETLAGYFNAKATLVKRAKRAVLNLDDEHHAQFAAAAREAGGEIVGYGQHPSADVRLGRVAARDSGLSFELQVGHATVPFSLPMIGEYNAWNAAAAVAAALPEGITLNEAAARLADFPGVPGRMQVLQFEPFTLVVDFAHTPPALSKALGAVRGAAGRVLVVVGAAGERDPGKRAGLGRAAVAGADLALFTEEDSRSEPFSQIAAELRRGAVSAGGVEGENFVVIEDRQAAIAEALRRARPGDVVLLAGKGHERTLERASETIHWDEAAVAQRLLNG